ncbi:UDP-glucose/GDP-mannose dehydrogenase family protein [Candidatus Woesearchaeota archaeon]|nr:UDP-glucose/GDP-mannose dehydrogenase family protein [Candidatus Woesearchaeota archaeon]
MPDGSADLKALLAVVEMIAKTVQENKLFNKLLIIKSTVPPGTTRKVKEIVQKIIASTAIVDAPNTANASSAILVEVASNPEFLKQGNAVYDFNHPDKIVVGATSERAFQVLRKIYQGLIKSYIPYLEMELETAEMTKYANNAFLATKISFINEIANICALTGADVKLVAKAIGMDYRIGPKFLNAGIGYGGSCFPKDVLALVNAARQEGYQAKLLQEVHALNERQKRLLVPQIIAKLQEVQGTTITLWGTSFKPKTNDLRSAPALVLIEELLQRGGKEVNLRLYDPISLPDVKKIFATNAAFNSHITYCSSVEESVEGSNLIVLVTEWDEFRNVSFAELGKLMKNKIIFDGRNIYDPEAVREEGFAYYGVGRK